MSQNKAPSVTTDEFTEEGKYMRKVRSFVRREGRLTPRQANAIESLWGSMGIDYTDHTIDITDTFGRDAVRVLEVGFGMGASLVEMAKVAPETDFLGIEVHRPGVGACLADAQDNGVTNLRVMQHDAVEVIENMLPEASFDRFQLFFPDPWHKKRHHKRRIVQPEFIGQVLKAIKTGGVLHLATDWENYAEHMLEVLSQIEGIKNLSETGDYVPRPDHRPLTKFEQRGHRLGHGVWDLMFEKV